MLSLQSRADFLPRALRDCGLNAIVLTSADGPVREMVMPFVDGETYAGRMPSGFGAA